METTSRPRPTAGRGRASARGREDQTPRDEFDLLTAMLMGVAIGSAITLLFRRGPRGQRPVRAVLRAAGTGAAAAGRYGARGARWVGERGEELWDRVPADEIVEQVGDYLQAARETINDVVSEELRDLRKAIRRQRKRIGI